MKYGEFENIVNKHKKYVDKDIWYGSNKKGRFVKNLPFLENLFINML